MMRDKLGLFGVDEKDKYLILDLLTNGCTKIKNGLYGKYFLSFNEYPLVIKFKIKKNDLIIKPEFLENWKFLHKDGKRDKNHLNQ